MRAEMEALKYSDERYRIAAENSSEIILDYNVQDGSVLHVTKSVEKVYGVPQKLDNAVEALIEKGIVTQESSEAFRELFAKIHQGVPEAGCVIRAKTVAGDIRCCEMTLTTVFDDDQKPVRAIGILKDITPQKKAGIQYEKELFYRNTMQHNCLMSYEADLTHCVLISGYEALQEGDGLSETGDYTKILYLLARRYVYAEDRDMVLKCLARKTLLEQFSKGNTQLELDYRRTDRKGGVSRVRGTAYLTEDMGSDVVKMYFYVHDINEIKVKELSLREKEEKDFLTQSGIMLQAVADSMSTCTYIIDPRTCKLKFINHNTKLTIPGAQCGSLCYQAIRGRTKPCEDCPVIQMMSEGSRETHAQLYLEPYRMWCKVTTFMISLEEGRELALFNGYDFTEYKNANGNYIIGADAFTQDTVLYKALCNSTDDFLYMCDVPKKLFYFPRGMVEEFDLPGQVVENAVELWGQLIHPNERNGFLKDMEDIMSGAISACYQEYRVRNREGRWVWVRCRGYVERNDDGNPSLLAGVITSLEKKSNIDFLSGLLNKYAFDSYVNEKLVSEPGEGIMLMLGLDNFKSINSLYGWEFGDHVIRDSAQRIQSLLPDYIPAFRLDGDKFALFVSSGENIHELYRRIRDSFEQQQHYENRRYYCTVSGGYAEVEDASVNFTTLLKQAEYALEYSKAEGKSRISSFSEELMSSRDRMLTLIECLRESVDNDFRNFDVFYQPQVEVATREIKSAEALLRWKCDEYGEVTPTEFVPLLEQTGLIHFVGRWILEKAVGVCKEWRERIHDFTISVNLSYIQLQDPEFLPYLSRLIESYGMGPSAIHLELTERSAITGKKPLSEVFKDLRGIGLGVEMDDFGTGYSSLELLKRAPADVVKIDRAFVMEITENEFDATFIRVIVTLCHSVDIKVCLEGVETWREFHMVEPMGLDLIQGFLFGRPQNKNDFEKAFLMNSLE